MSTILTLPSASNSRSSPRHPAFCSFPSESFVDSSGLRCGEVGGQTAVQDRCRLAGAPTLVPNLARDGETQRGKRRPGRARKQAEAEAQAAPARAPPCTPPP